MVQEKTFPAPRRLGPKAVAWIEADIELDAQPTVVVILPLALGAASLVRIQVAPTTFRATYRSTRTRGPAAFHLSRDVERHAAASRFRTPSDSWLPSPTVSQPRSVLNDIVRPADS